MSLTVLSHPHSNFVPSNFSGYQIFDETNRYVNPEKTYLVKCSDIIDEGPSSPGINEAKRKGIKLSVLLALILELQQ